MMLYITTLQRSPLYTPADFLAICGGLFGLFLGASVMSIIEFAYYSTLRFFYTTRPAQAKNVVTPISSRVSIKTSEHSISVYSISSLDGLD